MTGLGVTRENVVAGRLVLEDSILPGRLVLEGERIVDIEFDPRESEGPYICPGFIDMHVHGWGGCDAMSDEQALTGMARALLRRGVTSFLPTAVTASLDVLQEFASRVRRWTAVAPEDGAEPLGFNIEGPFLCAAKKGAQNPDWIQSPAAPALPWMAVLGAARVTTVAPELEGAVDLIRRLSEKGVVVSLGHSAATATEAEAGYAAGAKSTTHLFNAMSGIDHHAPGLATAALANDNAYVEVIADGFHVVPRLWPLIFRTKPAGRVILVSDAISLAGTGDGRGIVGGLEVEILQERCLLVSDGHLAGSLIALDSAVRNVGRSGVGLTCAVRAASQSPATLLDLRDRGRLDRGLRADLVELDDNLGVRRVMRGGRWWATAAS